VTGIYTLYQVDKTITKAVVTYGSEVWPIIDGTAAILMT